MISAHKIATSRMSVAAESGRTQQNLAIDTPYKRRKT
jgi:hypothetical protein